VPVRVLCVDDHPDVADSEVLLLTLCGHEARACYDGSSALNEAATFRPTVCLIDLNMPGMDGDELAIRLRHALGGPPPYLVAVTAMGTNVAADRIQSAGFDRYFIKPVDPMMLVSFVQTFSDK
jgi:two-component system, OmpR family, response regulator